MGRSTIELYADVLKVMAEGNRKPTHIMYKANLSWLKLEGCLSSLGKRGLIKSVVEDKGVRYEITERGMKALDYFGKMESALRYPQKSNSAIQFHH
ncbi:MAG: winged helix-turn-helix domain-containing protein [Candidatus Bathyarchaeia archaeon]